MRVERNAPFLTSLVGTNGLGAHANTQGYGRKKTGLCSKKVQLLFQALSDHNTASSYENKTVFLTCKILPQIINDHFGVVLR